MKDQELAQSYLEFDKHAKARYLKLIQSQGDLERLLLLKEQYEDQFKESPPDSGSDTWYKNRGGVTGLMRQFGRQNEHRIYMIWSYFAHGTVSAMKMLENQTINPVETLDDLIHATYTAYLASSGGFVGFIWGPSTIPEGEQCKNDFSQIISTYTKAVQ